MIPLAAGLVLAGFVIGVAPISLIGLALRSIAFAIAILITNGLRHHTRAKIEAREDEFRKALEIEVRRAFRSSNLLRR
jgi:hypothetical protein